MTDINPTILTDLEAMLIVADHPIPAGEFAQILDEDIDTTNRHLEYLRDEFTGATGGRPRGFRLRMAGGGWRLYAATDCVTVVEQFMSIPRVSKLSQAALETLAIVAYKQPVTRATMSNIRGVNVEGVVRSLQSKNLIELVSTDPTTGAGFYGTTDEFLHYMDINSLDELPPLAPLLPPEGELDELEQDVARRTKTVHVEKDDNNE